MYITTHRVRAPSGVIGINGALYRDGSAQSPTSTVADLERMATTERGTLVHARIDVARGSSNIEAFLAVAGADAISDLVLATFLDEAANHLQGTTLSYCARSLAVRFSCNLGLSDRVRAILRQLARAALGLRRHAVSVTDATLDIVVSDDGEACTFEIDAPSRAALNEAFPEARGSQRITVPFDAIDIVRHQYGRLFPTVVVWLTTKSLEELGGFMVRFASPDGTILWQWPR